MRVRHSNQTQNDGIRSSGVEDDQQTEQPTREKNTSKKTTAWYMKTLNGVVCPLRTKLRVSCAALLLNLFLIVLTIFAYNMLVYIYPEIPMTIHSTCNNSLSRWNGKIASFQIWYRNNKRIKKRDTDLYRLKYLNNLSIDQEFLHSYLSDSSSQYIASRSIINVNTSAKSSQRGASDQNIIIFVGTHHRTGTYLARKIFSVVCNHMSWCCVFHLSVDTIYDIFHTIYSEKTVHIIGHNHWSWYPEDIMKLAGQYDARSYRFVHFYRKPFSKIVSGLKYHKAGSERWTRHDLKFNQSCLRSHQLLQYVQSILEKNYEQESAIYHNVIQISDVLRDLTPIGSNILSYNSSDIESLVWEYCSTIHLCRHCCVQEIFRFVSSIHQVSSSKSISETLDRIRHDLNSHIVICRHLRLMNTSLQDHHMKNTDNSIDVESSINYYEVLAMMQIVKHTKDDPNTLNVDLSRFREAFEEVVMEILRHLNIPNDSLIDQRRYINIVRGIQQYNIKYNSLYRLFMTNLVPHITTTSSDGISKRSVDELDTRLIFERNKDIQQVKP